MLRHVESTRAAYKRDISHEQLLSLVHYDPETGDFTLIRDTANRKAGDRLGNYNKRTRYTYVGIFGHKVAAHRVAYFWMTGDWPPSDMDHINGDRGDNRWCNLRPCSRSENLQNRVGFAKSGHKLIVISKTPRGHTRYYCRIGRNGRTINSPTFYDLEAALAWRDEWLRCNGTAFTNTSHINDLTN